MIKIKHHQTLFTLEDIREIRKAREENGQLVRETVDALRRYERRITPSSSTSSARDDHEITDEEVKAILSKQCWTDIPHHWLSINDRRRREILPVMDKPDKEKKGAEAGNESDVKNHVDARNPQYALVIRQNPRKPLTPLLINPDKPLPLDFTALWVRRRLHGEPVSIDKISHQSLFSPLFSQFKPDNASIEALSEEEKDAFMKEVLPKRIIPKEGEENEKGGEKEKNSSTTHDPNAPVYTAMTQNFDRYVEGNVERKNALVTTDKRKPFH